MSAFVKRFATMDTEFGVATLVATRREAQTVFYRIADDNAARLLTLLKDIYCP